MLDDRVSSTPPLGPITNVTESDSTLQPGNLCQLVSLNSSPTGNELACSTESLVTRATGGIASVDSDQKGMRFAQTYRKLRRQLEWELK